MLMQKIRGNIANRKGFTLVELLVVVAILGILAALVVPKFADSSMAAKKAKIKSDLRTIDGAFALNAANGGSAATLADLVSANLLTAVPVPPASFDATGTPSGATGATYGVDTHRGTIDVGGTDHTYDTLSNW